MKGSIPWLFAIRLIAVWPGAPTRPPRAPLGCALSAPGDQGQLTALGDQGARLVPQLAVLLEESARYEPR